MRMSHAHAHADHNQRHATPRRATTTHVVEAAARRVPGDLPRLVARHHLIGADDRQRHVVGHAAAAELGGIDADACALCVVGVDGEREREEGGCVGGARRGRGKGRVLVNIGRLHDVPVHK